MLVAGNEESKKLPRVSASKLKLYEACPKQYLAKYLVPQEGELVSIYGVSGSAIHKAIEMKYKEGTDPITTFAGRRRKFVTAEVDRFEDYTRVLAEGYNILDAFDFSWYKPVDLEKHFKLPYPNEENAICTIEGYMDLVEDDRVVDFKSGKDKVDIAYVEQDLQFIIYYWAFGQIYGKLPKRVTYHRLKDHTMVDGRDFNLTKLNDIIEEFLNDPMEYELVPCEKCHTWCGVKRLTKNVTSEAAIV